MRQGQTSNVNSGGSAGQMGTSSASSRRQQISNSPSVGSSGVNAQQGHAATNAVQQLASRYQQLTKTAVAGQNQNNNSVANSAATANLLMAAAANPMLAAAAVSAANQQQAVAQQQAAAAVMAQQRLAAVAALSGFQQQQQQHSQTTGTPSSAFDQLNQFTQMQALLMNSLLCNAGEFMRFVFIFVNN